MVSLMELWLPIVGSAVIVFIASSIIHMVLGYHNSNYRGLPNEARILELMRAEGVTPGSYTFPYCRTPKDMGTPEMKSKYEAGPVGMMTVMPTGVPGMGLNLALWFGFSLLVSLFAAYIAGRTLGPDAHYLQVFRITGTAAVLGYAFGDISDSIWKGQRWGVTAKHVFDGLIFGLLTAGTFGWLWPR
jgi:hypothetical protein